MNQNTSSRRKSIVAIVITVWIAIAIWLAFFATISVEGTRLVYDIEPSDSLGDIIVTAVEQRLDGCFDGARDIRLIGDGTKLQVDLATTQNAQVDSIQSILHHQGNLRFLAMADPGRHSAVIDAAKDQIQSGNFSRDVLDQSGESIGRWVLIDQTIDPATGWPKPRIEATGMITRNTETGQLVDLPATLQSPDGPIAIGRWMVDNNVAGLDALAIVEPDLKLDADSLSFAAMTEDANGQLAIALEFTPQGGAVLESLTQRYLPVGQRQTRLGIVFDDLLITAPNILQPIKGKAVITGDFEKSEVQAIIAVLKAGRLPIELPRQPAVRETITLSKPMLQWPL